MCSANNINEVQLLLSNQCFEALCLDIDEYNLNFREVIQLIRFKYPSLNVLIHSNYLDRKLIQNLFQLGVKGFILKSAPKSKFIHAVNTIISGEQYIDENISKHVSFSHDSTKQPYQLLIPKKSKEILFLLCHELTILQIASHMGLSNKTVEKHRAFLFKTIGVKNMVGLALFAFQSKIHSDVSLQQKYSCIF